MPGQFDGLGLSFLYPENWKLEQEDEQSVTLETPQGSFLTIARLTSSTTAEAAIDRARATMEEEYDAVEHEVACREYSGIKLDGLIQRFVFLDLIITAQFLTLEHGDTFYLVQIQGEDRDIDQQQLVFDAILTSMCQHLGASSR